MKCFGAILLLLLFKLKISFATENDGRKKCSYDYCLPIDYNKLEAPFKGMGPLEVEVTLEVLQILEVDETRFTVSLLMDLHVSWEEFRITGPTPDDPSRLLLIDIRFVQSLWLPDIYIYNMKEIVPSKFNIPYAGNIF